ncbi:MAG: nickel transport protein [Paracoccaceae bacterium]|jgi:nickel transport protein
MRAGLLTLCLMCAAAPATAHRVILSVFVSGDQIEGELGFSNGAIAAGTLVEVFDPEGAKLGEVITDTDGFFVYEPRQPITHVFRANLGQGHVAEVTMPVADLPRHLASGGTIAAPSPVGGTVESTIQRPVTSPDLEDLIASVVRDEVRPLRREVAAYREKNDLQSILGGIGYIVGLFGVGFYLAARRKLKDAGQ